MTPTTMLMRAHTRARAMEIRAPDHTASKVELPEAPVPRHQWMFRPNFAMAAAGVRCFAELSIRLANSSYPDRGG